jgi:hypothetical protein
MSDIAKELFKTIVTGTASQEDFSSAIKQKMDQALDVRKAGITAGIYNQQSASSETFEESVEEEINEASSGDIGKILKFVAKNGAKVKGNVADFGGTKIEFSFDKGKIKFDGGKDSGVEYFDNLRDAISTLSIGMED